MKYKIVEFFCEYFRYKTTYHLPNRQMILRYSKLISFLMSFWNSKVLLVSLLRLLRNILLLGETFVVIRTFIRQFLNFLIISWNVKLFMGVFKFFFTFATGYRALFTLIVQTALRMRQFVSVLWISEMWTELFLFLTVLNFCAKRKIK